MSVSFLKRSGKPDLAYSYQAGSGAYPAIVFLPGFRSDMQGTKAVFLANHAVARNQSFLRLDYSGHGVSGGRFEDGTIGQWTQDALAVIDATIKGPTILVGSSMGGWIGLLVALARPDLVRGFVGIAAAPDFTRDIKAKMNDAQHHAIETDGYFSVAGEYSPEPVVFTRALLEDGEAQCLLDRGIALDIPVRLLQGKKDEDVPWQWAEDIKRALHSSDVEIIYRDEGDHRLSTDEDLAILAQTVDALSAKISG